MVNAECGMLIRTVRRMRIKERSGAARGAKGQLRDIAQAPDKSGFHSACGSVVPMSRCYVG